MLLKFTPFYHNKQRKSWEISTGEWRGEGSKESRSEPYLEMLLRDSFYMEEFVADFLYVPAILDKILMTLPALTFDIWNQAKKLKFHLKWFFY